MKKRIFMYLFVFAFIMNVYQYANSKRYLEAKTEEITDLEATITDLEAKVFSLKNNGASSKDAIGYSLKTNKNARRYFEEKGLDPDQVILNIKRAILKKNATEGHPLVNTPNARVRYIDILNNSWILVKYTTESASGEALISYTYTAEDDIKFTPIETIKF